MKNTTLWHGLLTGLLCGLMLTACAAGGKSATGGHHPVVDDDDDNDAADDDDDDDDNNDNNDNDDDTSLSWSLTVFGANNNLYGVWGVSPSSVFVVGVEGNVNGPLILHYNGSLWSQMSYTTSDQITLFAVWGNSATDVFAVGQDGAILHYDGSWSAMNSGKPGDVFTAVWGTSSANVFVAGTDGDILQYDGHTWASMPTGQTGEPNLYGLWGSSAFNVIAVGGNNATNASLILHFNGASWSAMPTGWSNTSASAVWGSSGSDVFCVGPGPLGGMVAHYDGVAWSELVSGAVKETPILDGVWGSAATNVYAVGQGNEIYRSNGGHIWSATFAAPPSYRLTGIWGSSRSDVFAVGSHGLILHYGVGDDDDDAAPGACCAPYNSCSTVTQDDCDGTWFAGQNCATFLCGTVIGACCRSPGDCDDNQTQTQCAAAGGSFTGDSACAYISC